MSRGPIFPKDYEGSIAKFAVEEIFYWLRENPGYSEENIIGGLFGDGKDPEFPSFEEREQTFIKNNQRLLNRAQIQVRSWPNVETPDNYYTPFLAAAKLGALEVMRVLWDQGADPFRSCYDGNIFTMMVQKQHWGKLDEVIDWMHERYPPEQHPKEYAELFLHVVDRDDFTALRSVMQLQNGSVDIEALDHVLDYIKPFQSTHPAEFKTYINMQVISGHCYSVLDDAIRAERPDLALMFLNLGLDPDRMAPDRKKSPLHLAVEFCNTAQYKNKRTSFNNQVTMIKWLIDVSTSDMLEWLFEGKTAWDMAGPALRAAVPELRPSNFEPELFPSPKL